MEQKIKNAPGLKWMRRSGGRTPYWIANEADVAAGYRPKTVNLSHLVETPDILAAQCRAFQAELELWRAGHRRDPLAFDGTIRSVLSIYQTHPRSPYHNLKPGTLTPYNHYLGAMDGHIGRCRISEQSGLDVQTWHDVWTSGGRKLAAGIMAVAVLEAALSFGKVARLEGCGDFLEIVRETRKRLPRPKRRTATMTAEQVTAARAAAHAAGRPSRALAYAMVYESVLRLWDVLGQWWPMDAVGLSDVIDPDRGMKWFGLQWEDVGDDQIVRYTPSKTAGRTDAGIVYPLAKAPMVQEELRHWPAERRKGPMIVCEDTGLPYNNQRFSDLWRVDAKAAGIAGGVWARDLRASGVTEARALGASRDDARKVAGHASERSTEIYDRAILEASDRFAEARVKGRKQTGNGSGNAR